MEGDRSPLPPRRSSQHQGRVEVGRPWAEGRVVRTLFPVGHCYEQTLGQSSTQDCTHCQGGQRQPDSHEWLMQHWLGKPRTPFSVTPGLELCSAAAAASCPFSGSQHLTAVLAHIMSPVGFPSLFTLISLASSSFPHSLSMIPAPTLSITKVTRTVEFTVKGN